MRHRGIGTLFLGLTMLALALGAGPARGADRPKVGLVLSGGGALGVTHLGVLKVLEELHVPVDCIAGTSMGAIIGGLYAAGLSPDQIEAEIKAVDWADIFFDDPPRTERTFQRKQEDRDFLVKYRLGFRNLNLSLPKGLIKGQKLGFMLKKLTMRAAGVTNFDRLTIPFRAVAADIATGEAVVLGHGDLGTALQASMSVPGAFPPVEIDGRLLVDGGLANNLPVDVARSMGAEVVIVVDIPSQLLKKEEMDSVLAVVQQSITLLIQMTSSAQLGSLTPRDILIQPDLSGISSASFDKVLDTVAPGRAAAERQKDRLGRLSVGPGQWAAWQLARAGSEGKPFRVEFIKITNQTGISDEIIRRRLSLQPGQDLDPARLERDLHDIYGLGHFERVDFRLVHEGGRQGLEIIAQRKSEGQDYLRFGVNLEEDFQGRSTFNLAATLTFTELNRLAGEMRLGGQVGDRARLFAELYQPLDPDLRWFVAPRLQYGKDLVGLYADGERIAEFRARQVELDLAAGRNLGNWGQLRLGVLRGVGRTELLTGHYPEFDEADFNDAYYYLRYKHDTLDNPDWPTAGRSASLEFRHSFKILGGDADFKQVRFSGLSAHSLGRNTLILSGEGGFTFDGRAPLQNLFNLGGFLRLTGYARYEVSNQNALLARAIVFRRVAEFHLGPGQVPIYLGGSGELGNVWASREDVSLDDLLWSASAFIGTDTVLGPLYLGYGYGGEEAGRGYLFLGGTF